MYVYSTSFLGPYVWYIVSLFIVISYAAWNAIKSTYILFLINPFIDFHRQYLEYITLPSNRARNLMSIYLLPNHSVTAL